MEFAWWGAYPRTRTRTERDSLARNGNKKDPSPYNCLTPYVIMQNYTYYEEPSHPSRFSSSA